jgi:hypothetical protein
MSAIRRLARRLRAFCATDTALALVAFAGAWAVYLRTLHPGLVGTGDTPKFQFVGRILGTAHNPGYPLYCVIEYLFGQLPLGTPAHRMNLLASLCGALAVGLVALAARRMAAGRIVALATAWSFAFGPVFWSQCTLAEVYALAAALLAAIVWALLRWAERGRVGWLRAAVVLAAVSVGHHLTIVTIAPALVLFVLLTRPRDGLRPRFLAFAAIATLLGLAQYGYVLLRTWQGAAYLGSSARNLSELFDVMRGRQFGNRLFVFDAAEIVHQRLPLIGGILGHELGLVGALLALVGMVVLARRQRPTLALLLVGSVGLVVFALNYNVPDIAVFLIPGFVLLWLLVGVALEACAAAIRRTLPGTWGVFAAALVLALPAYQLGRDFQASDHSDRTFEIRYFDALFQSLPSRVAFVNETHSVDHMLLYKIHAEGGEIGREIYPIPARAADVERRLAQGATVFAFENGRRALKHDGFVFEPLRLLDRPVVDYLKEQPRGRLIALAAGGKTGLAEWLPRALGLRVTAGDGALAGIVPSDAFGQGRVAVGGDKAEATLGAGEGVAGVRTAKDVHVVSGPEAGWVSLSGQEVLRVGDGLAIALIDSDGNVIDRQALHARDGWRAAFPEHALPLWRVVGRQGQTTHR